MAIEVVCRVGPAVVFKVYRAGKKETICRTVKLQPHEEYVRVLDVLQCIDNRTGRVKEPLTYFSVREDEVLDTYNYALSLDPKSLNFQNLVAYMRRRMGGMSLITKELVEPWWLKECQVETFALTILIEAKFRSEIRENVIQNIAVGSVWEGVISTIKQNGRKVAYRITDGMVKRRTFSR